MENERLYIPIGVKVDEEIFKGINKTDLKNLIITALFLNLINLFTYFVLNLGGLHLIAVIFIFGISYLLWNKGNSNVSIANYLGWAIRYKRDDNLLKYIYQEEIK